MGGWIFIIIFDTCELQVTEHFIELLSLCFKELFQKIGCKILGLGELRTP